MLRNLTLLIFINFYLPFVSYSQDIDGVIDDPGDIAFLGMQRNAPEGFAFIFMDNCPAGTTIIFDDDEWNTNMWNSTNGEGANTWINNTGSILPAGTIITIINPNDNPSAFINNAVTPTAGMVTESDSGFELSNSNDGIFAYVGNFRANDVKFLAFIGDTNAPNSNTLDGTGLVAGCTAVDDEQIGAPGDEDEGIYSSVASCSGTLKECLEMINNTNNWTSIADGATFPNGVPNTFTLCVNKPSITNLSASKMTICKGENTTITITGNLNDATEWVIYSGSCGGTKVTQTSGSTFSVSPTTTTTYHIRGESTCLGTSESCQTIIITVNDLPNAAITISETSETPNDGIICIGDAATLTASGGTTYMWEANTSLSATNVASPTANPTANTNYSVTVTDANNCSAVATASLTVTTKNLVISNNKDANLNITDPCSCEAPLNRTIGTRTLFHDILTVTTAAGRSIWVSVADDEFRNSDGSPLPAGALPTTDPGGNAGGTGTGTLIPETTPGTYQLDFYHLDGVTANITVTDGFNPETFTSSRCTTCVEPIPTISEWGLFILSLIVLNLGIVLIYKIEKN